MKSSAGAYPDKRDIIGAEGHEERNVIFLRGDFGSKIIVVFG